MSETWLCADWHCGETRLDLLGRPFESTEEMMDVMIANHNKLVDPNDKVIVVGDVCRMDPNCLNRVADFNGKKTLIRGNHDRRFSDEQLLKFFEVVIPEDVGLELKVGDISCFAIHYPTLGRPYQFNLTAHVHAAWKYQLNQMNIGVDVHHFRPVNLESVPFHFKAICEFYDNDVWVAYEGFNEIYKRLRGKKSSYYSKDKK